MAFLAARPTHAQKRLAGALAALLFVLFAPTPSLALLDQRVERSTALTLSEARAYMLELINRDRTSEGLSPQMLAHIEELFRELKATGVSMLLVEQQVAFALRLADRVLVMSKGQLVYEGTPADMVGNPEVGKRYLGL